MNILWIMTDQHRADCLGCMGHPLVQTPRLDALARSSMVFENAFCQSPACMASRGSLLTGRYPTAIRVRGMGMLPPTEMTLPQVLQRHGYETALIGKVHLTPQRYIREQLKRDEPILDWRVFAADGLLHGPDSEDPRDRNYGFARELAPYEDSLHGAYHRWLRDQVPELAELPPARRFADGPNDLWVSPVPSVLHPTSFIGRHAEDFIASRPADKPWFAMCGFVAPHHPFEAPQEVIDRYPLNAIELPDPSHTVDPAFIPEPAASAIGEFQRFSPDIQRRIIQHYLASISLVDDNIGRILNALRRTGQMDNTLIIFNSDHGEFLGRHGLLRKPSLHYDETLRVPLLMHLPGQHDSRRISGLVELVDLFPTILGLGDIPSPAGVQGINWASALRDGGPVGREDIFCDMHDLDPMVYGKSHGPYKAVLTLRTQQWKINLYPTAGRAYGQLFNLEADPGEHHNLYGDPAWAAKREEMTWRLLERCHRNIDPLPPRLTQW